MCDFRVIEKIQIGDRTIDVSGDARILPCCDKSLVEEEGFYLMALSGAYYAYYDGTNWLYENDDRYDEGYTVISYTDPCFNFEL